MDTRSQITIRTKKLGVLLRDARLASRKTLQECGEAIGVTKGVFKSYEESYHQLMVELAELAVESIDLIMPEEDGIENIYITGGFSKNRLFLKLISDSYPMKHVYNSEINNATALGAALVIFDSLNPSKKPVLNLGLSQC